SAVKSMDPTRKLARLEFNRVVALPLGTAGGAAAPFARTMVEAAVCLSNEMVGGADRLREDALAYAMMRMQFGKPIASFQSMKHKQADMLLEVELAKSAAYYAAASLDDGDDDAVANAHLAKACAGDAYVQTAIHAVQIHGGIGFTWDNDTHLWFKRAKSSEVLLGDAHYHRELMLQNWPAWGERHDRNQRSFRPHRCPRLAGGELEPGLRAGGGASKDGSIRVGCPALAAAVVRPRPSGRPGAGGRGGVQAHRRDRCRQGWHPHSGCCDHPRARHRLAEGEVPAAHSDRR